MFAVGDSGAAAGFGRPYTAAVPYAEIDPGRLYYEQHGQGEALLCIQGLRLDVSGWRAQLPAWSARHQVTVFDNCDVGRSFYASGPYDIHDMAADAIALADRLGLEPHRQRRHGYLRQRQASATREARDRLASLSLPALVLAAEQDVFVPVWHSRELAEVIPGARLAIVAGAAHAVNVEHAAEYNAGARLPRYRE